MNWERFLTVYVVLQCLVIGQVIAAYFDKRLYHWQMTKRGVGGYSLTDHGGIWFDLIVMSGLTAYIVGIYEMDYASLYGLLILGMVVAGLLAAGCGYRKAAIDFGGEAHTHDGRTTLAGWLHGVYAMCVAWTMTLFYLLPVSPLASTKDILMVTSVLTPFFYIGTVKFSIQWKLNRSAKRQTIIGIVIVWAVTLAKLWLMR